MSLVSRVSALFKELKRRKVFQVASMYLVVAWGASLGASELFPAFGIPDWAVRFFIITALLGFPVALVLAWAFEITPEGVVLDAGREATDSDDNRTLLHASSPITVLCIDQEPKVFSADFVIGRDRDADLQIDASKVSRRHAEVFYKDNSWWIQDLQSSNGTRVDGELISAAVKIAKPQTQITLYPDAPDITLSIESRAQTSTEVAI